MKLSRDQIKQLARFGALAAAETFLGPMARDSIARGVNKRLLREKKTGQLGYAGMDYATQSMMNLNPTYTPPKELTTDQLAQKLLVKIPEIPNDPFNDDVFLQHVIDKPYVADRQDEHSIYVRTGKSADVPLVGDWHYYGLTDKELARLRVLELAWGRMGGHFGYVPQTKSFITYVFNHDPELGKKLVYNKPMKEAANAAGKHASIKWDMRTGIDWSEVAILVAIALMAYYIPPAFGAGGGGSGATVTATAAPSATTTATAAPATTVAKAAPVLSKTATVTKTAVTAGKVTSGVTAATTAAKEAAKEAAGITPAITEGVTLVDKAQEIVPKVVDGVNKARTVEAIVSGEIPPPPIDLQGDNFTDWAGSIVDMYLKDKMQGELDEAQRKQLEDEIRRAQQDGIYNLPPGQQPIYVANPGIDPNVQRSQELWQSKIESDNDLLKTLIMAGAAVAGAYFLA